jgi:hypothetical protein
VALSTPSRRKAGGGFSASTRRVRALDELEEHGLLSGHQRSSSNAACAEVSSTAQRVSMGSLRAVNRAINRAYPVTENIYLVGFAANDS